MKSYRIKYKGKTYTVEAWNVGAAVWRFGNKIWKETGRRPNGSEIEVVK